MASSIRKLIPLLDRILVKRFEPITTTKGGIVIPENAQSKVLQGEVLAVGPGSRSKDGANIPVAVGVGDRVLLPEFGGTKVQLDDKQEYFLFRESDILAKLE